MEGGENALRPTPALPSLIIRVQNCLQKKKKFSLAPRSLGLEKKATTETERESNFLTFDFLFFR